MKPKPDRVQWRLAPNRNRRTLWRELFVEKKNNDGELKNIYFKTCCDELRVFKPGNHSLFSSIPGMSEIKFKYAAKISSEYLTNKKFSLGEAIFYSAKRCKIELNSNYNLGIIMLCAPILKICMRDKVKNFKLELKNLLSFLRKILLQILFTIIFGIFRRHIYHGVFLPLLAQFTIFMKIKRRNISFPFSL